jgi:N-acetyl-anhydromuramyl-L-alanine amidase AmpD
MRNLKHIVIHCTATRENQNYTFEQCIRDHKARGFSQCGYHYFIRRDGTIHIGRPLNMIGAHVAGLNANSVGICYEGGLDENGKPKDTRTYQQRESILKCINSTLSYFDDYQKIYSIQILGHRDFSQDKNRNGVVEPSEFVKNCPCFDARKEYQYAVNNYVKSLVK